MNKQYISKPYNSPIGQIYIISSDKGVMQITGSPSMLDTAEVGDRFGAVKQLEQYFAGNLKKFDLPLDINITDFTQKVLDKTSEIPYGQTTLYGQIAKDLGNPKASRAVGGALNRNPVPIIIPCHRVLSQNSLRGFALGLEAKSYLLNLEGAKLSF